MSLKISFLYLRESYLKSSTHLLPLILSKSEKNLSKISEGYRKKTFKYLALNSIEVIVDLWLSGHQDATLLSQISGYDLQNRGK